MYPITSFTKEFIQPENVKNGTGWLGENHFHIGPAPKITIVVLEKQLPVGSK